MTFAGTLVEGRLRTTFVTPNVRTLSGYEAERYTADPDFWIEHVHPADRGRIEIQLTELAPEGPTETLEYRFRGAGGEELWLCDAVRVERLDPATLLLIGSRTRVGAQHVTDTVGRAAEGELASLLAAVPHGVQENDVDGRITYSNAAHHRILGYPDGVLIGKRVFDVQPCVASAEELRGYLAYLVAEQPEPTPYLTRSVRRDGSAVDLQIDWTYKRDHDGRLLGFISVITDVTDRKRAEDQLRQAAVVFENTAEGVIITDADERIIAVNAAFGSLTGYSAAEVLGQESEFLRCGRRSLALHERVVAALREQGHWQGEVWYRRKSGELFPAWQTVSVVQDDDGKISRHVAVFSDISPIKRSQEQLDHLAHHDPLTDL
ncbi:MAG: PAS domain-containing protein, partial [Chromatiales bacterium]